MGVIVIGVDESEAASEALRWAVDEGRRRGWGVRAVLAWSYLDQHESAGASSFRADYTERDAVAVLDRLVDATVPGAEVERVAVCDLPARAVLEASKDAELLVVGARGVGGFEGMLLGSVSQQCVHHSTVPVVVVRPQAVHPLGERIVVGVDGSENSLRALRWALDEARARSAGVTVVHASRTLRVGDRHTSGVSDDGVLSEALSSCDTSGVEVEPVRVRDSAANALLAASRDASLVVVGSRGHGGFARLMLGSASQHVVNHSQCPVVVVPPAERTTS